MQRRNANGQKTGIVCNAANAEQKASVFWKNKNKTNTLLHVRTFIPGAGRFHGVQNDCCHNGTEWGNPIKALLAILLVSTK